MAQTWAKWFYTGKAWRNCRLAFVKSKCGICQRCGRPGDIVHHKVYLTPGNINDASISLNWENLELLCIECHNQEHMTNPVTAEGVTFDSEGNVVPRDSAPRVVELMEI